MGMEGKRMDSGCWELGWMWGKGRRGVSNHAFIFPLRNQVEWWCFCWSEEDWRGKVFWGGGPRDCAGCAVSLSPVSTRGCHVGSGILESELRTGDGTCATGPAGVHRAGCAQLARRTGPSTDPCSTWTFVGWVGEKPGNGKRATEGGGKPMRAEAKRGPGVGAVLCAAQGMEDCPWASVRGAWQQCLRAVLQRRFPVKGRGVGVPFWTVIPAQPQWHNLCWVGHLAGRGWYLWCSKRKRS